MKFRAFLDFLFLSVLALLYLWPGSMHMLTGSQVLTLSDGTDPAGAPYLYDLILRAFRESPMNILYGAVPTNSLNPPEGYPIWISLSERLALILGSVFITLEQLNAWLAYFFIMVNGLATYLYLGTFRWGASVRLGLTIAFTFSAFALARAKVHAPFAGPYFLPLTLLGLHYLRIHSGWSGVISAAICFLGVAISPFYFLLVTVWLTPFLAIYYFSFSEVRSNYSKSIFRLFLSSLPSVVLLLHLILNPLPKLGNSNLASFPATSNRASWPHPFLQRFGSQPVDFLTGNISWGENDWNPIRWKLNESARADIVENSNLHERTNGIRWIILILALICVGRVLVLGLPKKFTWASSSILPVREVVFFSALGIFGFVISLAPQWFGYQVGPSLILNYLLPQYRVPSRAGVIVLFSAVILAGFAMEALRLNGGRWLKRLLNSSLIVVMLIILDMPPLVNPSPIASILPSFASLSSLEKGTCGLGFSYPHVSNVVETAEYYLFLQRLRNTDCLALNPAWDSPRNQKMTQAFGLTPAFKDWFVENSSLAQTRLIDFVRCTGVSWVFLDRRIPASWKVDTCTKLGWNYQEEGICLAQEQRRSLIALPEACL